MDKIEKIRAEIKRLAKVYQDATWRTVKGETAKDFRDKLLAVIDSLPDEPDKDLEEAAEEYATTHLRNNEFPTADSAFIAGAQWQAEQDDRDVVFWKGMQHAIAGMKEDAVEGEVVKDINNKLAVTAKINLDGFKFGEKVRVIVLPKED